MHKACVLPCQCHLACAGGHRHFKIKTLMMMIWWSIKQQTTAKLLASPRHSEAHFVFLLLPHSHPRLSSHRHHHHPLTHRHLSFFPPHGRCLDLKFQWNSLQRLKQSGVFALLIRKLKRKAEKACTAKVSSWDLLRMQLLSGVLDFAGYIKR